MKEIYKVWSYETQQYDRIIGTDGLLTSMINKFMKIKQEASGWPTLCQTEEKKNKYTEEFLECEDVKLELLLSAIRKISCIIVC